MTVALIVLAVAFLLPAPKLLRIRCPELLDDAECQDSAHRLPTPRSAHNPVLSIRKLTELVEITGIPEWVRRQLAERARTASPQELLDTAAALDLLTSSLHAGLPMSEAVRVVSGGCAPGLRELFGQCASRLELGVARPWDSLAVSPALEEVAIAAQRSAQSGTALTSSFEETASAHRSRAADAGEAVAERAGVLIAGPLALCFLPAFVVLGLIPTIAGLADSMFEGMLP